MNQDDAYEISKTPIPRFKEGIGDCGTVIKIMIDRPFIDDDENVDLDTFQKLIWIFDLESYKENKDQIRDLMYNLYHITESFLKNPTKKHLRFLLKTYLKLLEK